MGSFTRTNQKIRVPKVRLLGTNGEPMGIVDTRTALKMAQDAGLDLVEISPNAEPPVCKIMDYGKFRYDESIKRKQARKQQKVQALKEIKFHANVDRHDLEIKMRQMRDFIAEGSKVKLTLTYRGRENAHKDLGIDVMKQVVEEMADVAICEQAPKVLGRFLGCLLAPKPVKGKKQQQKAEKAPEAEQKTEPKAAKAEE